MSLKYEPSSEQKRMRHITISQAISPSHLAGIFDQIKTDFAPQKVLFFFCFTLVTGPRRSLNLKLSDTKELRNSPPPLGAP